MVMILCDWGQRLHHSDERLPNPFPFSQLNYGHEPKPRVVTKISHLKNILNFFPQTIDDVTSLKLIKQH
jgi:hypothetical protein